MKPTFFIALLLIPFLGISQTTKPIEGFLGIKFGSSKAAVTEALKARGATLIENSSTADKMYFSGVKLGPREAVQFSVDFSNDKAYRAVFTFKAQDQPQTIDYYNGLVNDFNDIYGKGKSVHQFKSPYSYGDGYEVTALSTGNADMFTDWHSDKNSIQVGIQKINDDLYILAFYQDNVAIAAVKAAEKAAQKSDY